MWTFARRKIVAYILRKFLVKKVKACTRFKLLCQSLYSKWSGSAAPAHVLDTEVLHNSPVIFWKYNLVLFKSLNRIAVHSLKIIFLKLGIVYVWPQLKGVVWWLTTGLPNVFTHYSWMRGQSTSVVHKKKKVTFIIETFWELRNEVSHAIPAPSSPNPFTED